MVRYLLIGAVVTLNSLSLAQAYGQTPADPRHAANAGRRFMLSDEERTTLRRSIHAKSDLTTGAAPRSPIEPGYQLPDSVQLHALPGEVYRNSPRLVGYRFIQVGSHAYVVDPSDRTVVAAID